MTAIQLQDGIALLSGVLFDYNNPGAVDVAIEDIASALSNCCRFAGHLPQHYSVAQHAVNVSRILPRDHAFSGLMHDTAEAFTNDLPTPLKVAFPVFKTLEVAIETAMAAQFGFQYPLSAEVRLADLQMLKIEKDGLKRDSGHWALLDGIEVDHLIHKVDITRWSPERAREAFLATYEELRP